MFKKILTFRAVYRAFLSRSMPGSKACLEMAYEYRTFLAALAVGVLCPVIPAGFKRLQGPGVYSFRIIQKGDGDGIALSLKKWNKVFNGNHESLAKTA